MITTISATPLETVQIISIFTYLNTLSDFLYYENHLQEQDLYKRIPVVNALYDFFDENEDNADKKMVLVRKLLEGSDLYGEKENEDVELEFVNSMFDHIISTLVFENYGNIYGFLAEVVRTSVNINRDSLIYDIRNILRKLTFDNEYGKSSVLSTSSVEHILIDLIIPLFPLSQDDHSILSIDFIYAQAGLMFLRTGQTKHGYLPHIQNLDRNPINHKTIFDEYILVGHTIENLVETNKINESALSVFFLPALLNYAYKEKNNLTNANIQRIITDPNHWTKAFESLFLYIHSTFTESSKTLKNDYRYRLHMALANFKNRTVFARNIIETNCSNVDAKDVEAKVIEYVENFDSYSCEKNSKDVSLPNLKQLYLDEIHDVAEEYFQYEKESIREAFGKDLIESLNQDKVIIVRGSFVNEKIEPSADLLDFYYPVERKSVHYALIRKDYKVSLIKEKDNPTFFRKELNVSFHEKFASINFYHVWKKGDQDFESFLFNIASEKRRLFEAQFSSFDSAHEQSNSWEESGMSLIPFYSCITGSIKGEIFNSLLSCPMDTFLLFSVAGEMGDIASKIITATTQDSFSKWDVTLRTISSREFIRNLINTLGTNFERKISQIPNILDSKIYKKLGQASTRLKNNGIELSSIIDIQGFTSIQKIITKVNVARLPLRSVSNMLKKAKNSVTGSVVATDDKFMRHTVNVKSFDKSKNTGYGYKFIYLPYDEFAEIRHEHEVEDEILVIYHHTTRQNEIIYKQVDAETMKIKRPNLYLGNDGLLDRKSEPIPRAIKIPLHEARNCFTKRVKRNNEENVYCPRTGMLAQSFNQIQSAIKYIQLTEVAKEREIRHMITSFYFLPEEKTEMDFVKYWANHDRTIPDWSIRHRITEPELFYDLRFKTVLDSQTITKDEVTDRIESLYTQNDLERIILPPQYMRTKYLDHKAYYFLRFEDYFAIGNQQGLAGSGGYMRLGENTDEARRMRNALYRLAIRQHFDLIFEFRQTLYRGEKRPQKVLEKLLVPGKDFSFGRFTSASTNSETAIAFASKGKSKDPKVLYEIKFSGRYFRAKVEKVYATNQEESVLLPHLKFRIEEVTRKYHYKLGNYFKVVLQHQLEDPLDEMKKVLREVNKLKKSGTRFYADEEAEPISKIQCLGGCQY